MTITIDNPRIDLYSTDYVQVTWNVNDPMGEEGSTTVNVQRSMSPSGGFVTINGTDLSGKRLFNDEYVYPYSKFTKIYYRFELAETNRTIYTDPFRSNEIPDLVALEIARRNRLMLQTHIGIRCAAIIRKKHGPRCLECYDQERQVRTRSHCKSCFDTGYRDGYESPIPLFVNFAPVKEQFNRTRIGIVEPAADVAETADFPLLSPEDILVELENNQRWVIRAIDTVEKKRNTLKQLMQLQLLDTNRIEYEISIPDSVKNFTNIREYLRVDR